MTTLNSRTHTPDPAEMMKIFGQIPGTEPNTIFSAMNGLSSRLAAKSTVETVIDLLDPNQPTQSTEPVKMSESDIPQLFDGIHTIHCHSVSTDGITSLPISGVAGSDPGRKINQGVFALTTSNVIAPMLLWEEFPESGLDKHFAGTLIFSHPVHSVRNITVSNGGTAYIRYGFWTNILEVCGEAGVSSYGITLTVTDAAGNERIITTKEYPSSFF